MIRPMSLFWPLQLGGWLVFGVAMALSRWGVYPLGHMVVAKGVLAGLGLLVSLGLRPIYRQLFRRGASPWSLLAVGVVAAYFASLIWTGIYNILYFGYLGRYFGEPLGIQRVGQLFGGAVYHAFALFAWSVLYFGTHYYLALQQERERTLQARAEAYHAQLRALRYQLNPHFLFNTLNAVSTLVLEEKNREAAGMIARLSDFLRITLEGSSATLVPLADEIEFVRRYLEIEQIRFGDRLDVGFEVADDALAIPVPALILQPLIENAIRHAVSTREQGGRILVEALRTGETLLLRITDNGPGLRALRGPLAEGIGLANTRDRLRQLYGDGQRLDLDEAQGGGLCVSIHVPVGSAVPVPAAAVAG